MTTRHKWLLCLAVSVCTVCVAYGLFRLQQVASDKQRYVELRLVYDGVELFHENYNRLPLLDTKDTDGRALSSWRFAIAPFVSSISCRHDITLPWDSRENACYAERRVARLTGLRGSAALMALAGRDTVSTRPELSLDEWPEMMILFVEVQNTHIHWMQPGDVMLEDIQALDSRRIGVDRRFAGAFGVVFCGGDIWTVSNDVPSSAIANQSTVTGARQPDWISIIRSYRRM